MLKEITKEKMSKKAREEIKRSISEDVQFWQYELFKMKFKTEDFLQFKESFISQELDYRGLADKLNEIWLSHKVQNLFHHRIGFFPVQKYGLEITNNFKSEILEEIKAQYSFTLREKCVKCMQKIQVTMATCSRKTVGAELFTIMTNLSQILESEHPEVKISSKNKIKKELREIKENEEITKRQKKAEIVKIRFGEVNHSDLLDKLPLTTKVLLYTCLSKCKIWPKLMYSIPLHKEHKLRFLSSWFRSFQDYHKKYIKSFTDLWTMTKKEVRQLRRMIWKFKKGDDENKITNIFNLAWDGKVNQVKDLLLTGMDVNSRNGQKGHFSLLHIATQKNDFELFQVLEKFKPDPNIRNRMLLTPLFYAIENCNFEMMERLVKMGADVNAADKNGSNCFSWGIFSSTLPVLKWLAEHGARMGFQNFIKRSPLIKACFLNKPEVVKWLLEFEEVRKGLHFQDNRGRSALHAACWGPKGGRDGKKTGKTILNDSPKSLEYLLEAGVDVNKYNTENNPIYIFQFIGVFLSNL